MSFQIRSFIVLFVIICILSGGELISMIAVAIRCPAAEVALVGEASFMSALTLPAPIRRPNTRPQRRNGGIRHQIKRDLIIVISGGVFGQSVGTEHPPLQNVLIPVDVLVAYRPRTHPCITRRRGTSVHRRRSWQARWGEEGQGRGEEGRREV